MALSPGAQHLLAASSVGACCACGAGVAASGTGSRGALVDHVHRTLAADGALDLSTMDGTFGSIIDDSIYVTRQNDLFRLRSGVCSHGLFPGSRPPKFQDAPPEEQLEDDGDIEDFFYEPPVHPRSGDRDLSNLTAQDPQRTDGPVVGCTAMNLSHGPSGDFIFKSETALSRSGVGMVFWTALKTRSTAPLTLSGVSYLALMERGENDEWKSVGGYSWEHRSEPLTVSSVTIVSPDGSINRTFTSGSTPSGAGSVTYIGRWTGGGSPLVLNPAPRSPNGPLFFSPPTVRGFSRTNGFHGHKHDYSPQKPTPWTDYREGWEWLTYERNSHNTAVALLAPNPETPLVTMDPSASIETWHAQFAEGDGGRWTPLTSSDPILAGIPLPKKVENTP